MRYLVIRTMVSHEIIGLAELPDEVYVRRVYLNPDNYPLGVDRVSESEYTTYKAFELVPVLNQVVIPDPVNEWEKRKYADVYDPKFFYADDLGFVHPLIKMKSKAHKGQRPFKKAQWPLNR